MGKWCRWFGLNILIRGIGAGWLYVKRTGRGYSLWLQPCPPYGGKSPKYLCYVPKTLAEDLFRLDLVRARSLVLDLLRERYGHVEKRYEKFIIPSDAHTRRLGWVNITGVGGGRLILYRKRKGCYGLYLNKPSERYWKHLIYVPLNSVSAIMGIEDVENATDYALWLLERKYRVEQVGKTDYSITSTSASVEDGIGEWILDRLEDGDIEAIREYFDYNPQNAYELGYTKEDLENMGIFDQEELEEEDDHQDYENEEKYPR